MYVKIVKIRLHLLKLFRENCRFFTDTVYIRHGFVEWVCRTLNQ